MKLLAGYKTLLFNVVSLTLIIFGWNGITEYVDPEIVALILAIGNALLRFVTKSAVFKAVPVVLLCFALVGCATLSADMQELREFSQADAKAALARAERAGDVEGAKCWAGIGEILADLNPPIFTEPAGLMDAVEAARAARLSVQHRDGLLKKLNLACAPMINEATFTYGKLLIQLRP